MAEALEHVLELFRAKDWKFEVDEESKLVRTGLDGENGSWSVVVGADEETEIFLILSVFPQKCPVHRRISCAELLTRINIGMLVGTFEMDCDSGHIHFRTSLPFREEAIDAELLNKIVMFNLSCMDQFLPAIMSVIYAGVSPTKALAALERQAKAKLRSKEKPSIERDEPGRQRFMNN